MLTPSKTFLLVNSILIFLRELVIISIKHSYDECISSPAKKLKDYLPKKVTRVNYLWYRI